MGEGKRGRDEESGIAKVSSNVCQNHWKFDRAGPHSV
jgi:hypothetical protein